MKYKKWIFILLIALCVMSSMMILKMNYEDKRNDHMMQDLAEYTAETGDENNDLTDEEKPMAEALADAGVKPEDDPDAWYHEIEVDISGLREQNPDIVGWIYFEDEESISYPLLYSGDDYYLRRNYRKEEETAGSIYIDGNNRSDLSDVHTLIYGHNMRNLSMFGKLKRYKTDADYFENHRYFQIITEDAAYRYEIFAYKDVSTLTGGIYTVYHAVDDDFADFVAKGICAGSYMDIELAADADTHIVTLSTCTYDDELRFTVSAVRVDEHAR